MEKGEKRKTNEEDKEGEGQAVLERRKKGE